MSVEVARWFDNESVGFFHIQRIRYASFLSSYPITSKPFSPYSSWKFSIREQYSPSLFNLVFNLNFSMTIDNNSREQLHFFDLQENCLFSKPSISSLHLKVQQKKMIITFPPPFTNIDDLRFTFSRFFNQLKRERKWNEILRVASFFFVFIIITTIISMKGNR